MKRLNGVLRTAALAVVLVFSTASAEFGSQETRKGRDGEVPFRMTDWETPPGHYRLIAGYADAYLSAGPSNGNYLLGWSAVQNNLANYYILDVRSNAAFCSGHIPGSVNIPFATVAQSWNLLFLPIDQQILVICQSGMLSSQVGAILGTLGYKVRILSQGVNTVPAASLVTCPK